MPKQHLSIVDPRSGLRLQIASIVPIIAAAFLLLVGAAGFLGWLGNLSWMRSIRPDWPSMSPSTACGLMLSAIALGHVQSRPTVPWLTGLGRGSAIAAVSLALIGLVAYTASWNPMADSVLWAESQKSQVEAYRARMPPNTAAALLLGNAALLILSMARDRIGLSTVAGSLSILTMLLGLFGAAGYAGGISEAYAWGPLAGMSLQGAIAFVLFGVSGLLVAWRKGAWRWSVGNPVVIASALGMAALVTVSLVSLRSMRNFVENSHRVQHSQEVRGAISELEAAFAISLSGERGFAITGREDFLEAYTQGNRRADQVAAELRSLTSDDRGQQARLARVDTLLKEKAGFFNSVVAARRDHGADHAAALIDTGRGQMLADAFYSITQKMLAEEQLLLTAQQRRFAEATGLTLLVLPSGTLIALGLFFGALLYLNVEATARHRASDAVAASEERFRSLVVATSQIVWTSDATGNVRAPLPSWQAYTGQSDAEVEGAGWASALHPDDRLRAIEAWGRAIETCSLYQLDYRIRRRDGAYRNFSVRGIPVRNEDGSVREWVGACTDVTEARKAEVERDRFFTLSLDLMCIATFDGYFYRLNPAFAKVLGYSQEEMLSDPILDFVHPDDQATSREAIERLSTGVDVQSFENRFRCKAGGYRWFLWSCASVPDEGQIYATARDITDRKLVEAQVRALNEELDHRVVERTAQLEAANRELEAFSYSVSHDLRAPLRGVDSYSRMVLEDYGPALDEEGRRLLNVVRDETQRMGRLIDDLLAFSRAGRTEMRFQPINMSALVHAVVDKVKPTSHRPVVKIGTLPNAIGDHSLVQIVWTNLISNAFKFTRHQADPIIEIGAEQDSEGCTYYVKDNGAGFDPRYIHKLFGVFQRLHTEEEFEGTGVGLALIQRIVHRHGGTVSAKGDIDKGASFFFSLPTSKEPI